MTTEPVLQLQIEEYHRDDPSIYGCEIRDRLLTNGVCDRFNVPTINVINRIQQRLSASSPTSVYLLTNNASNHRPTADQRVLTGQSANFVTVYRTGGKRGQLSIHECHDVLASSAVTM